MNSLPASSLSTFGGSPITTAGAVANLDYLVRKDLQGNAHRVGAVLRGELESALGRLPVVAEVRGKGLMIGVELVRPGTGDPSPAAATAVLEEARRQGVLIGKGGSMYRGAFIGSVWPAIYCLYFYFYLFFFGERFLAAGPPVPRLSTNCGTSMERH